MNRNVPLHTLVHRACARHPELDEGTADHLATLIRTQNGDDPGELARAAEVLTSTARLLQSASR